MTTTDDQLSAYLDGQLDTDAAYEAVETALAENAATRGRLDHLVWAEDRLRLALRDKYMEPVPPHLIATVWRTPFGAAAQAPSPKVAPPRPAQPAWQMPWALSGWALAASVATIAWLRPDTPPTLPNTHTVNWAQPGKTVQDPVVLTTLNAVASGVVVQTTQGPLVAEGTVQRTNGDHCRALTHTHANTPPQHTWVCRENTGTWLVFATAASPLPPTTYTPAQGNNPVLPFPDPVRWLDAVHEQRQLEYQWQVHTPIQGEK